jgi:hypothetical protein
LCYVKRLDHYRDSSAVDTFDAVIASYDDEAIVEKATSERSRDDEKSRR